jgi:HK97 family phage prohead protease
MGITDATRAATVTRFAMRTIKRYPIVFDERSIDLGGFIEVIRPQAVDRILREHADVVALRNHDDTFPLGRVSTGSLRLAKDSRGLRAELDDSIGFVADTLKLIDRGDAPGGSFAFTVQEGGDIWSLRDGMPFREIVDMSVREVSLAVAFPAYKATARSESPSGQIAFLQRRLRQAMAR